MLSADSTQAQGPDLTRYFTVLGGVAAVLILLAVGLKRLLRNSQMGLRSARRSLHVVEVLPLGNRRQLAVVRCYDRTFAIGLGEKTVSLVAELDAEMVKLEVEKAPAKTSFIPRMKGLRTAPAVAAPAVAAPAAVTPAGSPHAASGTQDPFEALLEHAQAQLDARRAAERRAQPKNTQSEGLQELC